MSWVIMNKIHNRELFTYQIIQPIGDALRLDFYGDEYYNGFIDFDNEYLDDIFMRYMNQYETGY